MAHKKAGGSTRNGRDSNPKYLGVKIYGGQAIEAGSEVKFDNVLMLGDSDGVKLGDALKGATVSAKVVGHGRADKVMIVKFRRRKHHRKQMGHRQHYTEIEITGIAGGDKK